MLDKNSIIEITSQWLLYEDEDGARTSIEFSACYEQYLKMWSDPERLEQLKKINNMDDERLGQFLTKIKQLKEIGKRNPLKPPWANGPYIEFYTEPPTRFQFANYDEYARILNVLGEAGWRTFDQG